MPSVGMRRSTRVFGTRVLRSGRRLWMEPQKGSKSIRAVHGENKWTDEGIIDNSADGGGGGSDANDRCKDMLQENENSASMDMAVEPMIEERSFEGAVEMKNVDTMFGIVYRRKRKMVELDNTGLTEDKRYGKKFVRERWKKRFRAIASFETLPEEDGGSGFRELAIVVDKSSFDCGRWISCLLASVLSYMSRVRIGMKRLSAFMRSKPIVDVYSSRGVLFLRDSITVKNPGICIISESRSLVPLVCVEFSSIPSFFAHMQSRMYLRSAHMSFFLVASLINVYKNGEILTNVAVDADDVCTVQPSQLSPERDTFYRDDVTVSENDISNRSETIQPPIGITKSSLRNIQLRNSRKIQKRRSSLRRKRGRQPSSFRAQKASGTLASEFVRIRDEGIKLSPAKSNRVLGSSAIRNPTPIVTEPEPVSTQDVCVRSRCYANLLITEPDKCYREEIATITLELSASKRWFLAVMKDGRMRFSLTAQKVMRPSWSNRFTHATVWTGDGGWKLEFFNKQDWLIFKELYKECFERNMESAQASVIPVPGVQEVFSGADSNYVPFVRPNSYITVRDDELTRALLKKSANYDMDSDDEVWLNKLNKEFYAGREDEEVITPDSFELIIDALEKGFHCNPDENFDEQVAYDFCIHLERREAVEAIHNYWIKKRKQKHSALVRIFQLYQPRRIQVIPKSVFRKKRSFKRQASQVGRGKQRPFLKAIEAERNALEQQNNVHKLQEAKSAADRFEGFAILKRQKAQMLMENADLAAYKAVLAFRIAESAQLAEVPQTVASFFLG